MSGGFHVISDTGPLLMGVRADLMRELVAVLNRRREQGYETPTEVAEVLDRLDALDEPDRGGA